MFNGSISVAWVDVSTDILNQDSLEKKIIQIKNNY